MSFTHALATNRYGEADLIVSTNPAQGTHVSLTTAMAAAVSGQTIFLRDSVTENVTITPGVNIAAWTGGSLNTPSITGKLTMTGAGTSTISGIELITNSDFFLAVTGSAASIIYLQNCYLNCLNNTGISFTSSNSSAQIKIVKCLGNIATTGITLFASTSSGQGYFYYTLITNTGLSTTPSTMTNVFSFRHCFFDLSLSSSGAGGSVDGAFSTFANRDFNTTAYTTTGTGSSTFKNCNFTSGSASAISIGTGKTVLLHQCSIDSDNAAAITGLGTLSYEDLDFYGTSSEISVTTVTGLYNQLGKYRAQLQPCFLVHMNTTTGSLTGDGTLISILFDTTIFDQNSNITLNSAGKTIFTAPITGKYHFEANLTYSGGAADNTGSQIRLIASSRSYFSFGGSFAAVTANGAQTYASTISCVVDMTAGDTVFLDCVIGGHATKNIAIVGAATNPNSWLSGYLIA